MKCTWVDRPQRRIYWKIYLPSFYLFRKVIALCSNVELKNTHFTLLIWDNWPQRGQHEREPAGVGWWRRPGGWEPLSASYLEHWMWGHCEGRQTTELCQEDFLFQFQFQFSSLLDVSGPCRSLSFQNWKQNNLSSKTQRLELEIK